MRGRRPARAGRHAVKYGFTADTYREMYILCFTRGSAFRSDKAVLAEYLLSSLTFPLKFPRDDS